MDAVSCLDAKLDASAPAGRMAIAADLRRAALELQGSETALSIARFLLVGLVGLASDAATYSVCAAWGFGDAIARAVSLGLATGVTWRLNRAFTFGASRRSAAAEGSRYALVALGAQGANYLIFLGLRAAAPQLPALLSLVLSAACAATFSFLGQRFYTFGRASPHSGSRRPAAPVA
jgi:putative flippase GtrA